MSEIDTVPDWISPPGATILDVLEERGWTQADLAERMGYTRKHINLLVKGAAGITEEASLKLERVLGSTAGFWLNREAQYREALARQAEFADLKPFISWLSELPIADMVRFGWIQRSSQKVRMVAACLQFFGVATVDAWRERYMTLGAAYRASTAFEKKNGAVSAWVRFGEVQAETRSIAACKREGLLELLPELRLLTCETDPAVFLPKLVIMLAAIGIALVVAPAPKGCPVSGLTKWLGPDRALVMLSFRYKTNDHFWFTLFHELGHLVLHGKKLLFLEGWDEGLLPEQEDQADRWAASQLIPRNWDGEPAALDATAHGIRKFADSIGTAPGIVVGRMQHEGQLGWGELNELKIHYRWVDE
ncbi:MAG: helix-turn-helix domain-containing protein [Spirochaetota bacterium]